MLAGPLVCLYFYTDLVLLSWNKFITSFCEHASKDIDKSKFCEQRDLCRKQPPLKTERRTLATENMQTQANGHQLNVCGISSSSLILRKFQNCKISSNPFISPYGDNMNTLGWLPVDSFNKLKSAARASSNSELRFKLAHACMRLIVCWLSV